MNLLSRASGWLAEPSGETRQSTKELIELLMSEIERQNRYMANDSKIIREVRADRDRLRAALERLFRRHPDQEEYELAEAAARTALTETQHEPDQ